MPAEAIPLAKEIGRVPSMTVPLDADQEGRYQRLVDEAIMIDVHQHPFVCPEDMTRLVELLRGNKYKWGYEAVRHGGWAAVATANAFRGFVNTHDMSFTRFEDLQAEVALMLSDLSLTDRAVQVGNADQIEAAKQQETVGFLPTLEHLAIGSELERVDAFYGMGVRLAGLTYNRKNFIGDGMFERNDGGLSDFGIEVAKSRIRLARLSTPVSVASISADRRAEISLANSPSRSNASEIPWATGSRSSSMNAIARSIRELIPSRAWVARPETVSTAVWNAPWSAEPTLVKVSASTAAAPAKASPTRATRASIT